MFSINICRPKEINFSRLIGISPSSVLIKSTLAEPQRDARAHVAWGWAWEAFGKYLSNEPKVKSRCGSSMPEELTFTGLESSRPRRAESRQGGQGFLSLEGPSSRQCLMIPGLGGDGG